MVLKANFIVWAEDKKNLGAFAVPYWAKSGPRFSSSKGAFTQKEFDKWPKGTSFDLWFNLPIDGDYNEAHHIGKFEKSGGPKKSLVEYFDEMAGKEGKNV